MAGQKDVLSLFALVMALNFFVANAEEIINPGILVQKYGISEAMSGMTYLCVIAIILLCGACI